MISGYGPCSYWTYRWEGGFVNNPRDPGGVTNLGVTMRVYSAWLRRPVSVQEMMALTRAQTDPLYIAWYWKPVEADDLPGPLQLMACDMAVNAGVRESATELERFLGTDIDSMIGPNDIAAARGISDLASAVHDLGALQLAHYKSLQDWPIFENGWTNRVDARVQAAESFVTGGNAAVS